MLKLITPDGIEKTSYQNPPNPNACTFDNDVFRLKQIMHESYLREILLEEKLVNLQKEVLATWYALLRPGDDGATCDCQNSV